MRESTCPLTQSRSCANRSPARNGFPRTKCEEKYTKIFGEARKNGIGRNSAAGAPLAHRLINPKIETTKDNDHGPIEYRTETGRSWQRAVAIDISLERRLTALEQVSNNLSTKLTEFQQSARNEFQTTGPVTEQLKTLFGTFAGELEPLQGLLHPSGENGHQTQTAQQPRRNACGHWRAGRNHYSLPCSGFRIGAPTLPAGPAQ